MSASAEVQRDFVTLPKEDKAWSCPSCTSVNNANSLNCTVCSTGNNPYHSKKSLTSHIYHEQQRRADASGLVEKSVSQRFKSLFYFQNSQWTCPVCQSSMPGWRNTCSSCGVNLRSSPPKRSSAPNSPKSSKKSSSVDPTSKKSSSSGNILNSIVGIFSLRRKSPEVNVDSPVDSPVDTKTEISMCEDYVDIDISKDGSPHERVINPATSDVPLPSIPSVSPSLDSAYRSNSDIPSPRLNNHPVVKQPAASQSTSLSNTDKLSGTVPISWKCSMCGTFNRIMQTQQKCFVCNIGKSPAVPTAYCHEPKPDKSRENPPPVDQNHRLEHAQKVYPPEQATMANNNDQTGKYHTPLNDYNYRIQPSTTPGVGTHQTASNKPQSTIPPDHSHPQQSHDAQCRHDPVVPTDPRQLRTDKLNPRPLNISIVNNQTRLQSGKHGGLVTTEDPGTPSPSCNQTKLIEVCRRRDSDEATRLYNDIKEYCERVRLWPCV